MSLSLDISYISRMGLLGLVKKKEFEWNFRCPICKDSKRSEVKKRGYIVLHRKDTNKLYFYCHNCNAGGDFYSIFSDNQEYFPGLFGKYKFDVMNERMRLLGNKKIPTKKKKVIKKKTRIKIKIHPGIIPVSKLDKCHPAVKYLFDRQIPTEYYKVLYFTKDYRNWILVQRGKKKKNKVFDDPRIVFFIRNIDGDIVGFQSRSIKNSEYRYLTDIIIEGSPKIYGLDKINKNEVIYVFEGIFDSFFVKNSIAMLGMDLNIEFFTNTFPDSKIVFIFDNQKRNKELIKRMDRIVKDKRFGIVIFNKDFGDNKDINDMVLNGKRSIKWINEYILKRTFFGLARKRLEFSNWKP